MFWAVIILSGFIGDRLLQIGSSSEIDIIEAKKKMDKKRKLVRMLFNSIGFAHKLPQCKKCISKLINIVKVIS